jgi:type II secretory pathway pseudopilin PulG
MLRCCRAVEHLRGRGAAFRRRRPSIDTARERSETGDTLIEVLIALVVIGVTAVSILGAFATSISATSEHRTVATADSVVRSFAETFTYDVRLQGPPSGPQWTGCASASPLTPNYAAIVSTFNASSAANGYVIAIPPTGITNEGTCPATNAPPEAITATASSGGTVDATLVFVVSEPDQAESVISTTQYTISPTSTVADPSGGILTVTASSGTPFSNATFVNFGSTAEPATVVSGGAKVTATIPAESGSTYQVFISVTTTTGTTAAGPVDLFTYGPTVSNVTPNTGSVAGGTTVAISGTGFTANSTIQFGTATPIQCNATTTCFKGSTALVVTSPVGATGSVDVTVTNPDLPASDQTSPTSNGDLFTYGRSVTSVTPPSGSSSGGTSVVVSGIGFTGATSVTFEGVPGTITSPITDTSITVTSPPGAGVADIQVNDSTVWSTPTGPSDQFTYNGSGSTIVGLGIQLGGGTPTPSVTCTYKANGNNSCTISGVGCGGSTTFYVTTVDGNGNPVAVSTTGGLGILVGGSASPTGVTIRQGSFSTYASGPAGLVTSTAVTCSGHGNHQSGTETATLSGSVSGNTVQLPVTIVS